MAFSQHPWMKWLPTRSPRSHSQIYQDDRPRSRHFSAGLLQLTPVRNFKGEYQQTPTCLERSRASCASSSLEFQLKTIAQTATLAFSSAEDNIQDRFHHIQCAKFPISTVCWTTTHLHQSELFFYSLYGAAGRFVSGVS